MRWLWVIGLLACGKVELSAATREDVAASCEVPGAAALGKDRAMLPGRRCISCHRAGGMASTAYGAAGTVYAKQGATRCDVGGAAGVKVEILGAKGELLASGKTNSVGSFYFTETFAGPIRARLVSGRVVREMTEPVSTGDCASCHDGKKTGRLYLHE